MKRRVNSHDVARTAGVSQSTVSLVLSGRTDARIPAATRERVLAAARELNYSRNAVARALVTGKTNRLGIVAAHPEYFLNHENYYSELLKGVMQGVLSGNYNLLFHAAQYADWQALYEDILSGGTDGVLLVGRSKDDPLTAALYAAQFPTVCVSYLPDLPHYYAVDCDNEAGGYIAAQHLLSLGHRRLGILYPDFKASWAEERLRGVQKALREAGLPDEALFRFSEADYYETERMLHQIAAQSRAADPLTALFFFDEWYPQYIAENLPSLGLRVPQDIRIISFNSTEVSARTRPPLTSIYQPLPEIGANAAALLIELLQNTDVEPGFRRLPVRLDMRESTRPVR